MKVEGRRDECGWEIDGGVEDWLKDRPEGLLEAADSSSPEVSRYVLTA